MRLGAIVLALICCLGLRVTGGEAGSLVVTTSLLEAAAVDYAEALPKGVRIVRLIPPGSCPGHFDLSPRMVPLLQGAELVVRHDFQESLDAQLRKLGGDSLRIQAVSSKGSLLIPDNYATLSAELAGVLARTWPEQAEAIRARQAVLAKEIAALGQRIQRGKRPWQGAAAIASLQQRAFCTWLGLKVVESLPRPDDTSPRQLARLLGSKAVLVVGNLQSDAKAARSLAKRKGVPVAVFSNFPAEAENGYRDLLAANLKELAQAWQER
jgi:zinc transport system substrate-binding protein